MICISAKYSHIMRRKPVAILGTVSCMAIAGFALMPEFRSEFEQLSKDAASILSGSAKGSEGHNRIKLWTRTCKYISEKPLLGYGCEGISERLYIATGISNPHNEILTYAAYFGIPAAAAYVTAVLSVIIYWIRHLELLETGQRIAGMTAAGYFIASLTGVSMFYLAPMFFVLLGMASSDVK